MPLELITSNNKKFTPICHAKMKHLAHHCVTVNELMEFFCENTGLSDVICEKWSKFSGKINKESLKNIS